jgi:hypothetical protein
MSAALAATERDAFAAGTAYFGGMVDFLKSGKAGELTESELERTVEQQIRELARRLVQAHLETRAPGAAVGVVRGADGVERGRARTHERDVKTIFGKVEVSRLGYGVEGVSSLHPLDGALNLPAELHSLEVRRRAAEQAAMHSFDETVASLERQIGTEVGKRQVEELVERAALDFDRFYAQRSAPDPAGTGSVLVLSADGKGVVMLPRDLREATRKAAQERSPKLDKRLTKGEKRHRKRMATVATVYTLPPYPRTPEDVVRSLAPNHDPDPHSRARPEYKRVWASLEKDPEAVLAEAFREAKTRDPDRSKSWIALVDGNKTQLEILDDLAGLHGVDLTIIVDIIHVAEYVWDASLAFHAEASRKREEWVSEHLLAVLRGRASLVAGGIRRSATRQRIRGKKRKLVDKCADYLIDYKRYLRYDEYLAKGFPIATGVVEGACRHLVCDRMDVGARWSLAGAEAVLLLRALRSSGDFEEYWTYHEQQEYQRNHATRYAGGKVVPVRGAKLPIRRVK